jgi:hypothetical protein
MNSERISLVLRDFRFWLIIFILIRLVAITDPPLEISHNWRQATVDMIARNYHEDKTSFLYPMMDNAGEKSGITGTEFPLLNYVIAKVAGLFGWEHWYGRLINLLITTLGIWFFYRWIKEFIKKESAFPAGMMLLVSLWFSFSRKSMPDTMSMSIAFIGLYYGFAYLREGGNYRLLLFALLGTLGILCKLPAALALSPLAVEFILRFRVHIARSVAFAIAGFVALGISFIWYFYWFNYLIALGDWQFYMMGPGFPKGAFELVQDLNETLDNFYFESLKFTGFIAFLAGCVVVIRSKNIRLQALVALWTFGFLLFMIQAGSGFSTHDYYTIPFVPLMALVAGVALAEVQSPRLRHAFILVIGIEGIANQQHDFRLRASEMYKLELESKCDSFSKPDDLIVINAGQNPQSLYFCHRKGWSLDHDFIVTPGRLDSLISKGARLLILDKHKGIADCSFEHVYDDQHIAIFDLGHQKASH